MPSYVANTDAIQRIALPASLRAYWSSTLAANRDEVWIRVEAQGVADGADVAIEIHRAEEGKGPVEKLDSLSGSIAGGLFEHRWKVDLSPSILAEVEGPIALVVKASIEDYKVSAESPMLAIARPRFSV